MFRQWLRNNQDLETNVSDLTSKISLKLFANLSFTILVHQILCLNFKIAHSLFLYIFL